jgi:hypothetical protein
MTQSNALTLDLDHHSAGMLAGTLLSGESCAVPVRNGPTRLLLSALPAEGGMRLHLRLSDTRR